MDVDVLEGILDSLFPRLVCLVFSCSFRAVFVALQVCSRKYCVKQCQAGYGMRMMSCLGAANDLEDIPKYMVVSESLAST